MFNIWKIFVLGGMLAVSSYGYSKEHPALLIISFDGFRHDYYSKAETPNLDAMKSRGAYGDMINVFETKTFPNHHSLATGLYPESHGVLANKVYDPVYDRELEYSAAFWQYNDDVTPLWTLNEILQNGRHSGVMMWPGGEFTYRKGVHPTFQQPWNMSWSWEYRVDIAINWFSHPETPANLVMLYIEEPDMHAHAFGPDSHEVANQIHKLDTLVGYIQQQLKNANIEDFVNVFLLSDHGMTSTYESHIIDLASFSDVTTYKQIGSSPVIHIYPKSGFEQQVYISLQNASKEHKFSVYTKEDTPERWHISNCRRAPPVIVVAEEGYSFQDLRSSIIDYAQKWNFTPTPNHEYGMHGYDNTLKSMHPFFLAWGPSIRRDVHIPTFHSVDLYSLWAQLLRISSAPSNGSLITSPVQLVLLDDLDTTKQDLSPFLITLGSAAIAAAIIGGTGLLAISCLKKRHGEKPVAQPYRRMQSYEFDAEEGDDAEEEEEDEIADMGLSSQKFEEQRLLSAAAPLHDV